MTSRRSLAMGAAAALVFALVAWLWTVLDESQVDAPSPGGVFLPVSALREKQVLPEPTEPAEVKPLDSGGRGTAFDVLPGVAAGAEDGDTVIEDVAFTGRVVDSAGAPIDGASVQHVPARRTQRARGTPLMTQIEALPWGDFASTTTDASGRFVLPARELPASLDDDRKDPRAKLYAPNLVPQLVVRHPDFAARAWLCEGYERGDHDTGDIMLRAGASIVGRVVDEDGRPLAGAEFDMSIFNGPWSIKDYGPWKTVRSAMGGVSGPDGRFELRELWADQATFSARLAGYVPAEVVARLSAGEVHDAGDVELRRGAVIRGYVVDVEGVPIEGAEVLARASMFRYGAPGSDSVMMEWKLVLRGNDVEDSRTTTNALGSFSFEGLHLDQYSIFAGADGREPAVQRDVDLGDSGVLLVLDKQATILVTIEDARTGERVRAPSGAARRMAGKAVTQMEPYLDVLAERELLDVLDAADIEDGVEGLLLVQGAGSYRTHLVVSAKGYATNGFVLMGATAPEMATRTVRLVQESSVSGLVMGAQEQPLAGASLTLEAPDDLRVTQTKRVTVADDQGRYRFGDLRSGDWSLTAEAEGHVPSKPRTLIVAAETAHPNEDVQLFPGTTIRGLVISADGTPAANWRVTARLLDGSQPKGEVTKHVSANWVKTFTSPPAVRADHDGRFEFAGIPEGRYELKASPGAEQVLFGAAGEVVQAELLLRQQPVVTGRVTDSNGPVQGAAVSTWEAVPFSSWDLDGESSVTTDAFGEYTLKLWEPGTVQIAARHEQVTTPAIEVTADWGMTEMVDLVFGRGRVSGRVTDLASSEPIEGARINMSLVERQPDGSYEHVKPSLKFGIVSTDADGRFAIERMVPGPYRIDVRATGYISFGDTGLQVHAAGGPADLKYRLARGATISGLVFAADGGPPPGSLRVRVRYKDGKGAVATAKVGSDGRYEAVGLKGGSYLLRVESSAFTIGGGTNAPLAEQPVTVGDSQTVVMDIVLDP